MLSPLSISVPESVNATELSSRVVAVTFKVVGASLVLATTIVND